MKRAPVAFVVGLLAGSAAGYLWWAKEQDRQRHSLYSRKPMRRLAALGWLGSQPPGESILLLREYVGWEQNPVLQRRGRRLLARFENALA